MPLCINWFRRCRAHCAMTHAVDAVWSLFPAGSMTGAPKIRTMAILDDLEWALGCVLGRPGLPPLTGAVDLSVVIRTMVATADTVDIGIGGAIRNCPIPPTSTPRFWSRPRHRSGLWCRARTSARPLDILEMRHIDIAECGPACSPARPRHRQQRLEMDSLLGAAALVGEGRRGAAARLVVAMWSTKYELARILLPGRARRCGAWGWCRSTGLRAGVARADEARAEFGADAPRRRAPAQDAAYTPGWPSAPARPSGLRPWAKRCPCRAGCAGVEVAALVAQATLFRNSLCSRASSSAARGGPARPARGAPARSRRPAG